ncbi:hypothetical protein ACM01_08370 [Streptomyces viridochromogenes]|uniref:Uncharacterized protein n=1 Tax=Streptomyces viridochromogenes TaxID=1938 RepID=A0A0J7ZIP6_STRVR|nr:hypothetical protein [Streptomyces viridochromogenes]KMS75764.1 hypothetical protein ACM01_08370 [Streptomyces viridochromogenes]
MTDTSNTRPADSEAQAPRQSRLHRPLTDLFHLDLVDPGATTRTRLWRKVRAAHEDWAATRDSCLTAAQ